MSSPRLASLVERDILAWVLAPTVIVGIFLALFLSLRMISDIRELHLRYAQTVGRYVDMQIQNAFLVLDHIALTDEYQGAVNTAGHLRSLLDANPYLERITLVDTNDRVILSEPSGLRGNIYPSRPDGVTGLASLVSKPTISPATGDLIVAIDRLIPQGGRVVGELSLAGLQNFLFNAVPYRLGRVILTDTYGNVIVHPDTSKVRQQANIGHQRVFRKALAHNNEIFIYLQDGNLYLGMAHLLKETAWVLISFHPFGEVFLPLFIAYGVLGVLLLMMVSFVIFRLRSRLGRQVVTPLAAFSSRLESWDGNAFPPGGGSGKSFYELEVMAQKYDELLSRIREREAALRRSEENYRAIFERAMEGFFQSTPDGRFINVNPALAEMLGYESPADLLSDVTDIGSQLYVDPADRHHFLNHLRQDGETDRNEHRLRRRDGSVIWVELKARAVLDDNGEMAMIEGLMIDTTGRKEAEQEQRRLEEQLRQSQKIEALGRLTGGVAHDFNNLLHAIGGYIQLLLTTEIEPEKQRFYLSEMDRAAGRASDLVRRLLTFSRKMEVKAEPVDINGVIRTAVGLLERTIPKMVTISTHLAPDLAPIMADAPQIEQIIMNLCNNAVDAMAGQGTLRITTTNVPVDQGGDALAGLEMEPGDHVMVEIADTGHGMDAKTRERIYEPFFTTKEIGKGTGLGLATVYGIVQGHKGQIRCHSEPGKGAVFTILLPAKPGIATANDVETDENHQPTGNERILVVDDEQFVLEIAKRRLASLGYRIITCLSGEEALEVYKEQGKEIDLVVIDLGMPGMGGERCLQLLREEDPEVKVVVASGYATHPVATKPQDFGAAGFLSKPYRLQELALLVRRVLDGG